MCLLCDISCAQVNRHSLWFLRQPFRLCSLPLAFQICVVARERSGIKGKWGPDDTKQLLDGADVVFADVTDPSSLTNVLNDRKVDVIVSCLASRTGGRKVSLSVLHNVRAY